MKAVAFRKPAVAFFRMPVLRPDIVGKARRRCDFRLLHPLSRQCNPYVDRAGSAAAISGQPEYHGDTIRGQDRVLCSHSYGEDILERLRESGFREARIESPDAELWWGLGIKVIVATK